MKFDSKNNIYPSTKELCSYYGLEESYVEEQLNQVQRDYEINYSENPQIRVSEIVALAGKMFCYDLSERSELPKPKKFANTRLSKGHYKLGIKIFKIMAENSSYEATIPAGGLVKVGKDFYTGEDIFKFNDILLEAWVKRGVLSVKYWYKIEGGHEKEFYDVAVTELGKTVFDSEMISEIARISKEGWEFYFQAMNMVGIYLQYFKVSKKGIPEYKA